MENLNLAALIGLRVIEIDRVFGDGYRGVIVGIEMHESGGWPRVLYEGHTPDNWMCDFVRDIAQGVAEGRLRLER